MTESRRHLLEVANPRPERLPSLSVWQEEAAEPRRTMVASSFPDVPGFTCDSWCYESDIDFVGARDLGDGCLELTHCERRRPGVRVVTTMRPRPGAVDICARPSVDPATTVPADLLTPNLCWQLKRAPAFASAPDPYPEFVARCFLFTEDGPTRLDRTERLPIPVRDADDPYNNPPWVQSYLPVWEPYRRADPGAWAGVSPDRYVVPVIGVVSRDGRFLAALACAEAQALCQAWHDCLHNNPRWSRRAGRLEWRLSIYALENDPEELLRRVRADDPGVRCRLP